MRERFPSNLDILLLPTLEAVLSTQGWSAGPCPKSQHKNNRPSPSSDTHIPGDPYAHIPHAVPIRTLVCNYGLSQRRRGVPAGGG
jgi:hypothetical protein